MSYLEGPNPGVMTIAAAAAIAATTDLPAHSKSLLIEK
jgi:hypothetical protein